jgi:hypothetical protein
LAPLKPRLPELHHENALPSVSVTVMIVLLNSSECECAQPAGSFLSLLSVVFFVPNTLVILALASPGGEAANYFLPGRFFSAIA